MHFHSLLFPLRVLTSRLLFVFGAIVACTVSFAQAPPGGGGKGLIFYAEPPSTYVDAVEFASLTKQSIRYMTLVRPNGTKIEINPTWVLATIPYPPTSRTFDASQAVAPLAAIQVLAGKYPQYRAKLDVAAAKWKSAAEAAKALTAKPSGASTPGTPSAVSPAKLSIITKDGTKYENVTVTSIDDDSLSISHEAGSARIDFEQLSPELQRQYKYDPARAAKSKLAKKAADQARSKTISAAAKPAPIPEPVSGMSEARSTVVGTWTYVGEDMRFENPALKLIKFTWLKLVIRSDGTLDVYEVEPSATNWGKPTPMPYEFKSKKYADTGERYFSVAVQKPWPFEAILVPSGKLRFIHDSDGMPGLKIPGSHYDVLLTRGDCNPFSP